MRKARHAQAALGQAERARGVIVLGDRKEGVADQGVAIEQLEADDHDRAGDHRQPELLVEIDAGQIDQRAETAAARCANSIAVNCCTISASASVDST